jgi:hypothetical protein
VAALADADASLTSGAPSLAVAEPSLLLLALPSDALGSAIGNADAFNTLGYGMAVNSWLTLIVNIWLTVNLTLAKGDRPCQKGKLSKLKSASIAVPFAERRKRR